MYTKFIAGAAGIGILLLSATESLLQYRSGVIDPVSMGFQLGPPNSAHAAGNSPASTRVDFTSSNLPIIVIDTQGQTIRDEPKITADMGIIDNGEGVRNYLSDPFNAYQGRIGIETRGASSQSFPKRQYALETRNDLGENLDVALLGLPADNDWVLSAPYSDKSMMRNVLAYRLANDLGRYASRTRFCELVLNGDYQGVYVLMEKIKRGKNRVDIEKLEVTDTSGDAVTGGYIIKIDKVEGEETQGWSSTFRPFPDAWQRTYYQYHYPDQNELTPEQKTYIQDFVSDFETVMNGPNYTDPQSGYPAFIDAGSFVDFFIVNEISKNVDGYRLSTFIYKDRDSENRLLHMGPLWDFDLAFGNADYYNGSSFPGWQVDFEVRSDGFQIPFWWGRLMQDSSFVKQIGARWWVLRQNLLHIDRLYAFIDSSANYLDEAQRRNFERWPILGQYVWPNAFIGQSYAEEVTYLKAWLSARIAWMDANVPSAGANDVTDRSPVPVEMVLRQNYPNPFNPGTRIEYTLPGYSHVVLEIFDGNGRKTRTLVNVEKAAGAHFVEWDGRDENGQIMSTGVYVYRLRAGGSVRVQKMMRVR